MKPRAVALAVTAAISAAGLLAAGPANAASARVAGVQTPVDLATGHYSMSGSLVGDWYTTSIDSQEVNPDAGTVVVTGKERFEGCLDVNHDRRCTKADPTGTLRFTFVYWADIDPKTQLPVNGQCVHPITGGTARFAKAAGVIRFRDNPDGSSVYRGRIRY
jgi:hypothetical protein